jgi:cytochrome c peroxidase
MSARYIWRNKITSAMKSGFGTIIRGLGILSILLIMGCQDTMTDPVDPDNDLTHIPYQPLLYVPNLPAGFPVMEQPSDNPMTNDGILLGRKLFFDPILSIDSTISCSSCHLPELSFSDGLAFSPGVNGTTARGAMSIINVGFHKKGFFWDGRATTLEEQAHLPVEDPIEMGELWEHVEQKLKSHPDYPAEFRKAFGIENKSMINRDLATKAIAQFERSIISGGDTRYDRFVRGEIFLEDDEYNGYLMFFDFDPTIPDAECGHCHNAPLFGAEDFFNNGIQPSPDLLSFADRGLGKITGNISDNGKFKAPTLRNIEFTAPYMHGGQFQTLEEVIAHYNSGGVNSPNKSPLIRPLNLTESQKSDLLAFLKTLTDSTTLKNPAYQNPF